MVFKSTAYRMGYGKNVHGEYKDGKCLIYFKNRDNQINCKELLRGAGRVDLFNTNIVLNATSAVPITDGFVLSKKNKEIKSIYGGSDGDN